jgi:hypothetical protein
MAAEDTAFRARPFGHFGEIRAAAIRSQPRRPRKERDKGLRSGWHFLLTSGLGETASQII